MRARSLLPLTCGCLAAAFCGFATWRSVRVAIADWYANTGTVEGFHKALRLAPEDPELRAAEALFLAESDDPATAFEADRELRIAVKMNPYNSALLMTLGLREEFQGNNAAAEEDLRRAAAVDHQFKPAWTLANFYYRTHQRDKFWPPIRHVLNLQLLGYDPGSVFELCWDEMAEEAEGSPGGQREAVESRRIESMIPPHGDRPAQYLQFLVRTKRVDAALDAWTEALAAYKRGNTGAAATMIDFADLLVTSGRIVDAVRVWNELVERGILPAEPLNPEAGKLLVDPEFQFPAVGKAFGWRVVEAPGVFASQPAGSLRLEINGDEPEMFEVLSVIAPVREGAPYRLRWKSDSKALSSPQDPGFAFHITQGPGGEVTQCGPLLSASAGACDFVTVHGAKWARIGLGYARAQGTVRVSGVMQVHSVQLEPAR